MVSHKTQFKREVIINRVIATLRTFGDSPYKETDLLLQICATHSCSWRTAREYLKVARVKMKIDDKNRKAEEQANEEIKGVLGINK